MPPPPKLARHPILLPPQPETEKRERARTRESERESERAREKGRARTSRLVLVYFFCVVCFVGFFCCMQGEECFFEDAVGCFV